MKLSLYYPAKPWIVSQKWGISDPATYSRFGFTQHNGEDIALGEDKMIYAPAKGTIVKSGNQPNGGGIFIGFLLDDVYTFDDGVTSHVLIDFLHLDHIIGELNKSYGVGSVLAQADNTGFSTGPHTHIQIRRGEWNGNVFNVMDKNEANNSINPDLYWNGSYAVDQNPFSVMQRAIKNFQLSEGITDFAQQNDLSKIRFGNKTLQAAKKYYK